MIGPDFRKGGHCAGACKRKHAVADQTVQSRLGPEPIKAVVPLRYVQACHEDSGMPSGTGCKVDGACSLNLNDKNMKIDCNLCASQVRSKSMSRLGHLLQSIPKLKQAVQKMITSVHQ